MANIILVKFYMMVEFVIWTDYPSGRIIPQTSKFETWIYRWIFVSEEAPERNKLVAFKESSNQREWVPVLDPQIEIYRQITPHKQTTQGKILAHYLSKHHFNFQMNYSPKMIWVKIIGLFIVERTLSLFS